jgi:hypothetical protein
VALGLAILDHVKAFAAVAFDPLVEAGAEDVAAL